MAVNKVVYGSNTIIDITDTTAIADTVLAGYNFYRANGVKTAGAVADGDSLEYGDPTAPLAGVGLSDYMVLDT